mmetsp:Transcript_56766/g.176035  ORF Transcript_56766/g.176035 Transcript_56766/m.176035 type:complete len:224 (+) Transcript_56766:616-1287(+)
MLRWAPAHLDAAALLRSELAPSTCVSPTDVEEALPALPFAACGCWPSMRPTASSKGWMLAARGPERLERRRCASALRSLGCSSSSRPPRCAQSVPTGAGSTVNLRLEAADRVLRRSSTSACAPILGSRWMHSRRAKLKNCGMSSSTAAKALAMFTSEAEESSGSLATQVRAAAVKKARCCGCMRHAAQTMAESSWGLCCGSLLMLADSKAGKIRVHSRTSSFA